MKRDKAVYSLGDKLTKSRLNCWSLERVSGDELTARGSEHSPFTASSTAATDLDSLITDSSISEVGEQPMNYCPVDINNPVTEIRPESGGPYLKGICCNPCLGNMGPTIEQYRGGIMVWVLKLSHPQAANSCCRWIMERLPLRIRIYVQIYVEPHGHV